MGCMHGFFKLFTSRKTLPAPKLHTSKRNNDDEEKKKSSTSAFIARQMCLKSHNHTVAPVSWSENSESLKPHSMAPSPTLAHALSFSDWKEKTLVVPEDDCQSEVSECFSFRVSNGELVKHDNKFVELLLSDLKEGTFVIPEDDCQSEVSECFSYRVSNGELIKDGNEFVKLLETEDHKVKKIVPPAHERLIESRSPFPFITTSREKHVVDTRLHNHSPGILFPWPETVAIQFWTENPVSRAMKPSSYC